MVKQVGFYIHDNSFMKHMYKWSQLFQYSNGGKLSS